MDNLSLAQQDRAQRILSFDIDGKPVALSFETRLAREQGWSRDFARRVVAEYKRFLVLAACGDRPVTPSEEVDAAWHLHLTYTRSYWDRLCGEVLGKPLHHDPTQGGEVEQNKFLDWYARTLDTYRRVFGEDPPADIWPAPAQRFAPVRGPRPTPRRWPYFAAALLCIAGLLSLAQTTAASETPTFNTEEFIWAVLFGMAGIMAAAIVIRFLVVRVRHGSGVREKGDSGAYIAGAAGGCGAGGHVSKGTPKDAALSSADSASPADAAGSGDGGGAGCGGGGGCGGGCGRG